MNLFARGRTPKTPPNPTRQMPFVAHLVELRRRLIFSLAAVLCTAIVCWIFYGWIVDWLIEPYCSVLPSDAEGLAPSSAEQLLGEDNCKLLSTDPLEPLSVRFSLAIYGGMAVAMPFLLWQLWRFVVPALKPAERRYAVVFVLAGAALFAIGAALAYWTIPRALGFLRDVGGDDFVNVYSPRNYVSFVSKMMLAFGIGFEFPLVLVFAQLLGLVQPTTLRRNRHYAVFAIVVLGAVLTPSGDPVTLLILSVPLYLFYELAIVYGWLRARRRAKAEKMTSQPAS